jgi:hypothetical protein
MGPVNLTSCINVKSIRAIREPSTQDLGHRIDSGKHPSYYLLSINVWPRTNDWDVPTAPYGFSSGLRRLGESQSVKVLEVLPCP